MCGSVIPHFAPPFRPSFFFAGTAYFSPYIYYVLLRDYLTGKTGIFKYFLPQRSQTEIFKYAGMQVFVCVFGFSGHLFSWATLSIPQTDHRTPYLNLERIKHDWSRLSKT